MKITFLAVCPNRDVKAKISIRGQDSFARYFQIFERGTSRETLQFTIYKIQYLYSKTMILNFIEQCDFIAMILFIFSRIPLYVHAFLGAKAPLIVANVKKRMKKFQN